MAPRQSLPESPGHRISALGVVAPPPILVQTPSFEGSLATLFYCVRDHRIDLLDVPLCPICEAYFAYLIADAETDLDEAAAALSALSYMLERKAWLLLPSMEPEPEVIDPLELVSPTVHEFDLAIDALRNWQDERSRMFFRSPEAGPDLYELPYTLANVSPDDLARSFERLLHRAQPEETQVRHTPRRSLSEQMRTVLLAVCDEWRSLERLVTGEYTRTEAVYWFLALLELIRLGQVNVRSGDSDVEFARA